MTLEQAKQLKIGQIVFHYMNVNSKGEKQRWKVTSIKTWKRNPNKILIGLKNGLYSYGKLTERDLHNITLD